jgi:hypothetical protein
VKEDVGGLKISVEDVLVVELLKGTLQLYKYFESLPLC